MRVVVPCLTSVTVEVVRVAGSISSEKVAVTVVLRATEYAPWVGDVLLTVGAVVSPEDDVVFTVQVRLAGVESVLPAESVALTSKVWLPFERPV
jgi:hypothetical protein